MRDCTPARARADLEFLADERQRLLDLEAERSTVFTDGTGQELRPEYSYERTREGVAELDRKTVLLRHALHAFDVRATLPESGVTVDEARIRLDLMRGERRRLAALRDVPREGGFTELPFGPPLIGHERANFDVERAGRDYLRLCEDIADLQLELSRVEQTERFSVRL